MVSEFLQTEYSKDAFIELPVPIEPNTVRAFYYTDMNTLRTILSDPKRTPQQLYDF